jgi:hypothetical protein
MRGRTAASESLERRYSKMSSLPLTHGLFIWISLVGQGILLPSSPAPWSWFAVCLTILWLIWPYLVYRDQAWVFRRFFVWFIVSALVVAPLILLFAGLALIRVVLIVGGPW